MVIYWPCRYSIIRSHFRSTDYSVLFLDMKRERSGIGQNKSPKTVSRTFHGTIKDSPRRMSHDKSATRSSTVSTPKRTISHTSASQGTTSLDAAVRKRLFGYKETVATLSDAATTSSKRSSSNAIMTNTKCTTTPSTVTKEHPSSRIHAWQRPGPVTVSGVDALSSGKSIPIVCCEIKNNDKALLISHVAVIYYAGVGPEKTLVQEETEGGEKMKKCLQSIEEIGEKQGWCLAISSTHRKQLIRILSCKENPRGSSLKTES